jgi:hypothetical protein
LKLPLLRFGGNGVPTRDSDCPGAAANKGSSIHDGLILICPPRSELLQIFQQGGLLIFWQGRAEGFSAVADIAIAWLTRVKDPEIWSVDIQIASIADFRWIELAVAHNEFRGPELRMQQIV